MISRRLLVAVGPAGMAARSLGASPADDFALSRLAADAGLDWLAEGLEAARDALGVETGTPTDVLVLRPLALGKIVKLPPLGRAALRALCDTNFERFFPVDAKEWSAAGLPLSARRGGPRPTLVTASPHETLRAIHAAGDAARLRIARVVAAPAAAAFHARELCCHGQYPSTGTLELDLPGISELVRMQDGIPTGLIPLPTAYRDRLLRELDEGEPACAAVDRDWSLALGIAACAATRRRVPEPLSPALRAVRQRRLRVRSASLLAAAAGFLVVALGLQVLDQRRELASLKAARAAIAPDVERVLEQHRTVEDFAATARQLAAAETESADWPALFQDLAVDLPPEAYATHVSGRPDSLIIRLRTTGGPATSALGHFEVREASSTASEEVELHAAWLGNRSVTGASHAD